MNIRKHKTKANRLLARDMMRGKIDPSRTYVLVEGNDDYRLWSKFKARMCELIVAHGKDTVIAKLRYFNSHYPQWRNVAAIIDPDYWLIDDLDKLNMSNLLYDDVHSWEVTLVTSPALETVMRNTLPTDVEDSYVSELRETAIRLATDYGYIRLLDHRQRQFNLGFNQVSFEAVIDKDTFALDMRAIAEGLVSESSLSASELLEHVDALRQEVSPDIKLCRGHDVLAIMSCLIRFDKTLSDKSKIQLKSNELARSLRIAFDWICFAATALYRRIRHWESAHSPFRIIRPYPT